MPNNIVAITIGDVNGIGLEILIQTWNQKKINNFILFTDIKIINKYIKDKYIKKNINVTNADNKKINYLKNKINIFSYRSKSLEDNTYKSLHYAYDLCKKKQCIGIITLPIRKDLIKQKIDKNFIGHTEYFQNIDKKRYSNMILYHKNIIISPLTTHIKLKDVSRLITNKKFLYNQIINLNKTL